MKNEKKIFKRIVWFFTLILIFINIIAAFHAYKFTHFTDGKVEKTVDPDKLSTISKLNTVLFGIHNPRPENIATPDSHYSVIKLKSDKSIECWNIALNKTMEAVNPKGTIIICHGYGGDKSSMLDKAKIFAQLGFNTFLIDFRGSGGSEGNQTTIGYKESKEVKSAYDYLVSRGEKKLYLFGTSMGAVAIMKAINDYNLNPKGIIIECPFGTMYETVCARFKNMNLPTFPMAGLLVFWGGLENGFWAFGHKPVEYAKSITCPTLLMYGEKDKNVSRQEIDRIYSNLTGYKSLKLYKLAGHENYLIRYKKYWTRDVKEFLLNDS